MNNSGTVCGGSNPLNYGLFTNGGFISDGNSSADVPADHPASSLTDTLFAEIDTFSRGTWDDTRQSTIDGLNIQFNSTAAP